MKIMICIDIIDEFVSIEVFIISSYIEFFMKERKKGNFDNLVLKKSYD